MIAANSIAGLRPARATTVTAATLSRPTRLIASAIRNPAKKSTMIGSKNGASAPRADATSVTVRTTGTARAVTKIGTISDTQRTITAARRPSTTSTCTGGRRAASNVPGVAVPSTGTASRVPSGRTRVTRTSPNPIRGSSTSTWTRTTSSTGTPAAARTATRAPRWVPSADTGSVDPTVTGTATTVAPAISTSRLPGPCCHEPGAASAPSPAAATARPATRVRRSGDTPSVCQPDVGVSRARRGTR